MICFLDVDEVLVDFIGAALALHDIDVEKLKPRWPMETWSASTVLGISSEEFWKPIHEAGARFWVELPEKPWIDELLYLASARFSDCYLVTAPSLHPSSYAGKVEWIRRRFGRGFDRFLITPHKELLAAPGRVLIDDRTRNVDKFESRGGESILFPFWGNANRDYLDDPVTFVGDSIDELLYSTSAGT